MKKRFTKTKSQLTSACQNQTPHPLSKSQSQTLSSSVRHDHHSIKKNASCKDSLYDQLSSVFDVLCPTAFPLPPPPAEPAPHHAHAPKKTSPAEPPKRKSKRDREKESRKLRLPQLRGMGDEPEEAPEEGAPEEEAGGDEPPPEGDEAAPGEGEAPAEGGGGPAEPDREKSITDKDRGSTISNFPLTNSDVLLQLKEADEKAVKTAQMIESLKNEIAQFSKKENMTEDDVKNLQKLHEDLMAKLSEFENISRNVQKLLGLSDISSSKLGPLTPFASEASRRDQPLKKVTEGDEKMRLTKSEEDNLIDLQEKLPKVIVCGTRAENEVPKIIVCEGMPKPEVIARSLTEKLSKSYEMQEKLANENAEMEGSRYQLQEAVLSKDRAVESLQKQVNALQQEMRLVIKENSELQKKLLLTCQPPHPPMCKRELYLKFAGALPEWDKSPLPVSASPCPCPCPTANGTNKDIEKQITMMEDVVANMKSEICSVQTERRELKSQKQLLQCSFAHQPPCKKELAMQHQQGYESSPCAKELEYQLRDLNEQYCRLDGDYKDKICEISRLRIDVQNKGNELEQLTERCQCAEAKVDNLFERLKMVEAEKAKAMIERGQFLDMEHQMALAKQHWQEAHEESEALQTVIQEQNNQIDDYRNKYLNAQQLVEEQKRMVEKMNLQSCEIKEQLLVEVQQYKNQIQERMAELLPLPDKLKNAELKLALAEQNIEELTKELVEAREIIDAQLNSASKALLKEEKELLTAELERKEIKIQELKAENADLKASVSRFEEMNQEHDWLYEEKVHECTQLATQLATVREESARQVVKTKERCEAVRRIMSGQISILEKQLAESRASASAAAKERDEIRQKMQQQMMNLNDNFGQAQMRIKCLQDHINFLKTTSV